MFVFPRRETAPTLSKRTGSKAALALVGVLACCGGLPALTITEIAYHPRGGVRALEFIEIFNETAEPVDLSGHRFARGVSFLFPPQTLLAGRSYLVVCADENAIRNTYGIVNTIGNWSADTALNNGGETLELVNEASALLARVDFNDRGRWPAGADGTGFTLEICDPYESMDHPGNWRVSSRSGGSPGHAGDPSGLDDWPVRINEALTLPAADDTSRWLELYNRSARTIDLSGFHLSRDRLDLAAGTLPSQTVLTPRGFLVLDETDLGFELKPDRNGEVFVSLATPDQQRIVDAYAFRPTIAGASEARVPDGGDFFSNASSPTPGEGHREQPSVVINEILYHPLANDERGDHESAREFIELYNRGQDTVDLGGWRFTRGVRFTFPSGLLLRPDAYLVVAKDPDALSQRYGLDRSRIFGPDSEESRSAFGRLSNGGERVRLVDAFGNIVDQVRYFDGGEWPHWSDGGGASLELIDPRQDNAQAQAWDASDETGEAPVTQFSYEGMANSSGEHELHFALAGAGIVQVDDIEMRKISAELDVVAEIIALDDPWRILPGRSEPAAGWRRVDFDDDAWKEETAPIGFGVGDEGTVLVDMRGNYTSVYFRRVFTLENPDAATALFLEVQYDDGFAAYVNGTEVDRENLEGSSASHTDVATETANAGALARVDLSREFPGLLVAGTNVVAVQVHNVDRTSRDFRFAARLAHARLVERQGPNVVRDADFESTADLQARAWPGGESSPSWVFEGTHIRSGRCENDPIAGDASLKIVATGPGDNKVNRIETSDDGLDALDQGAQYQISFQARAIVGTPVLLTHGVYKGGGDPNFAAAHRLPVTTTPGTPGEINSVTRRQIARHGSPNLGPTIADVRHEPAVPSAAEVVTVSARITDADGVARAEVRYSCHRPSTDGVVASPLVDEDGDGIFVGQIPGPATGVSMLYWIVAADSAGSEGRYPLDRLERTHPLVLDVADASANDLDYVVFRIEEPGNPERLRYRYWLHAAQEAYLDTQRLLSNDAVSGTLVFDDRQIYVGARLRFSGSPFARQKWMESYRLRMPDDRRLWGRFGKFNLEDHQGLGAVDGRERIANHLLRHNAAGVRVPYQEHWLVEFQVNDRVRAVRDHVELPSREYLGRWYGDDDDGPLFELDARHTINDAGFQENFHDARLAYPPVGNADHGGDPEFYRYFFNPRGGISSDHFDDVIELCRVFDPAETDDETFDESIDDLIDVEQFLRVFSIRLNTDDRDSWGGRRGKNYYFYRPLIDGRWALVPWDMELTFLDPLSFTPPPMTATMQPEYSNVFAEVQRFLNRPRIQRHYYAILAEMVDSHFDPAFLARYLDGLEDDGVLNTNVGRAGGFVDLRRRTIIDAVRGVRADVVPFSGEALDVDGPRVVIAGSAPIEVRTIRTLINGAPPEAVHGLSTAAFSDHDVLGWSYTATLALGDHRLEFFAFDGHGTAMDKAVVDVRVTSEIFLRGDADRSGRLNISDAVLTVLYLAGRSNITCHDALDSNDNGRVEIADVIFLLSYLFLTGEAPAMPFPALGADPTADSLGCNGVR